MRIDAPTEADVRLVAQRVSARHRAEVLALTAIDEADLPDLLAQRFGEEGIAAYIGSRPVAVGRVFTLRPNVATLAFITTDDFRRVAKGFTMFLRDRLFPSLRASGVHRIECLTMDEFVRAKRWITLLGLRQEAVLRGYGRGGEDFVQFAWVDDARPVR